ncbi:AAA family ATPase [Pseudidiomarina sp. PP-1MA]|uniref:DNA 3'-5' helicase II n=1 Tax=Pseudidiomarina sp. PP-1MA TaxID=3237706 RepID=A0AB39X5K6_9GAMM
MNERIIRLPELSDEQFKVLGKPKEGFWLLLGGPGTGKSVLVMQRLKQLSASGDALFLAYNKVLHSYCQQVMRTSFGDNAMKITTSTIFKWLGEFYDEQVKQGRKLPKLPAAQSDYDIDYEVMEASVRASDHAKVNKGVYLVVDEGQDMPEGFYNFLVSVGFENIFVAADFNQTITERQSTREELVDALALSNNDVLTLKENYRNSSEIAKFSQFFYSDKSTPPSNEPTRVAGFIPTLLKCKYRLHAIKLILREADNDPRKLIGVIVGDHKDREFYISRLRTLGMNLENPRPTVATYKNSHDTVEIDFAHGGIVVLCDASVKGLEFDVVYVCLDSIWKIKSSVDEVAFKKSMYVNASRAKEKLFLLKNLQENRELMERLPNDPELMQIGNLDE